MKKTNKNMLKQTKLHKGFSLTLAMSLLTCLSSGTTLAQSNPDSFITPEFLGSNALLGIRAQYAYAKGYTGKGILIAVVDDGLDIDHPKFLGKVSPHRGNYLEEGAPDYVGRMPGQDDFSHGTHVAGIAAAARTGAFMHGVAYDANILPLRILGSERYPPRDTAESEAFDRAIAQGVGVLNGSYGPNAIPPILLGEKILNPDYEQINFQALDSGSILESYEALKRASDADIVMVFAAGNEYDEQPIASLSPSGNALLPAITPTNTKLGWYRFFADDQNDDLDINNPKTWNLMDLNDPEALALDFSDLAGSLVSVVAVGINGDISSYSNRCGYAQQWCIAAPGGDFEVPGFTDRELGIYSTYPDNTYESSQGTSMAAPVVSGAAAVLREAFPYMSAKQIIEVMLTSANNTDKNWGDKETYGWGMLDLGRAVDGPVQFGASGFAPIFEVDTKGWNSVWDNDISGQGGLSKSGQGHLVMNGYNTYQGNTQIHAGKLSVNGALSNSNVTIESAAALSGSGTVKQLVVAGLLQPGNSIGTFTVTGDYTQLAGSTLEIEIDGSGASDLLKVHGQADLQGGQLQVLGLTAETIGKDFRFLDAGQLNTAHSLNTTDLGLPYVATHVITEKQTATSSLALSVRRSQLPFAALASTTNQVAVAQALDQHPLNSAEFKVAVMLPNAQAAEQLYGQLTGEIHASSLSAIIDTSSILRQASLGRLAHADLGFTNSDQSNPAPHGAWARALGSWGALGSSADTERLTRSIGGMMFGADTQLDDKTRAGLAAAFTRSSYKTPSMGSATADGYHLMAYAGQSYDAWSLRGGASYSWYNLDTQRHIDFARFGEQKANYHLQSAQVFAELAHSQTWDALTIEPYANVAQVWTRRGGFQEDGGIGALQGASQTHSTTLSTLGLRTRYEISRSTEYQWNLGAGLGWRHLIGKKAPSSDLSFSTGPNFSIQGAPLARNALMAELGAELSNSKNSRFSLLYTGQIAGKTNDHGVQLRASWAF